MGGSYAPAGYAAPVYTLAKFLQAVGLVLLPFALWWGISHDGQEGALTTELLLVGLGAVVFAIGRRLEPRT
jgi:hypothetical protein